MTERVSKQETLDPAAIIHAYREALGKLRCGVGRKVNLPYSKQTIRAAIRELLPTADENMRAHLEAAYIQLELFLVDEEFEVVRNYEDATRFSRSAVLKADETALQEMTRTLREAPVDEAEAIHERITDRMQLRARELRRS